MKVTLTETQCIVKRQPGDPKYRDGGWGTGESRLLYHVKKILNERHGCKLIKKRMQADGHMYGDEKTQYLRSKNPRDKTVMCIYDNEYAIRNSAEDFNKLGRVVFRVEYLGAMKVASKGMRQSYPYPHK